VFASPSSIVPDQFGTDWTAEIGNYDVRMKADHVKTTATTDALSSHPGENGVGAKNRVKTLPMPQKTRRWKLENDLQIYEAGQK
jgi:hypothetical protein